MADELARRTGQSPQNFNSKMKGERFTINELEVIVSAANSEFERNFKLPNGEKI
jgi:hypothetical protein